MIPQATEVKQAGIESGKMSLRFRIQDRGAFSNLILRIKSKLEGRRWNGKDTWYANLTIDNMEYVLEWGFAPSAELIAWYKDATEIPKLDIHINREQIPINEKLFPFQEEGVLFLEQKQGKALLADEMGLGKTIQTLTWLAIHPELRPVVIIVPNTVKIKWGREIEKWLGEQPTIVYGRKNNIFINTGKWIVLNYDIVKDHIHTLQAIHPKVVVLDECHYIKNRSAQRTFAVNQLTKRVKHIIALSGTPIINRPVEFFNILKLIQPQVFSSFWHYAQRYCNARHTGFGWDFSGASNIDELHKKLINTIMIRRTKKDVLKELPPITTSIIPVEIDNRQEYIQAEQDIVSWIREHEGEEKAARALQAEALVRIEKLKQIAVRGKMAAIREWISDFLDSGQKLAIFCTHQETIDCLKNLFASDSIKLDGRDNTLEKTRAVDTFNNDDKCRLLIANIRTGGVGIDLTATSNVALVELGWTPGEHDQAENRCHGIGRGTRDPVTAYYLLAKNTIEEEIAKLLDEKRKVLEMILDGKEVEETRLLTQLLQQLTERR